MDDYDNIYAQEDEYYQYQCDHDRRYYYDYHADTNSSPDYEDYRYSNSKRSKIDDNSVMKSQNKTNTDEKYSKEDKIMMFASLLILIPVGLFCVVSIVLGLLSGDIFDNL